MNLKKVLSNKKSDTCRSFCFISTFAGRTISIGIWVAKLPGCQCGPCELSTCDSKQYKGISGKFNETI